MYHDNERPQVQWDGSSYTTTNYRVENVIPPAPEQKPKKKKSRGVLRAIALVLCCTLIGGGAGVGGAALYMGLNPSADGTAVIHENTAIPGNPVSTQPGGEDAGLSPMSLSDIYDAYANACVVVNSTVSYTSNTWYGPMTQQGVSAGSGFIIAENGYIVTNYHVIDGASEIKVTLFDGAEYPATFVGGEEGNDVAVLKIDAGGLDYVVLGDSGSLKVGETVCTIGNAVGTMAFSQTSGIVSGLGRTITYSDGTVLTGMIQTNCTINSGNSGGPMFDSYGRVVGITSAKYSNNGDSSNATIENIGFAIPINDVKGVITDIMEHGYVIRPYMGITAAAISEDNIRIFGWPNGVYVNDVEAGSCAEAAGIRRGDIITRLGDTEISSVAELTAAKNRFSPGDTADITVYRAGENLTLSITFDSSENPTRSGQQPAPGDQQQGGQSQDGWPYGDLYGGLFGGR